MKIQFNQILTLVIMLTCTVSCGDNNKTSDSKQANTTNITSNKSTETKGPFAIKSGVIKYHHKNSDGSIGSKSTLFFDNYGQLVKLMEEIEDATNYYIFNDATGKGITKFGDRTPSKILMRQGEINMFVAPKGTNGFVKLENEILLDKDCEVFANNAKTTAGESKVIYWIHNGIPIKEINRLGTGYQFEAVSFDEKPLDQKDFSLPAGAEAPHDIF